SGDCRQPVRYLLHHGDRKRQVRIRMGRRQRFFRNRVGLHHRRMRLACLILTAGLLTADAFAAEIPLSERRSGYSFMTPDTKAMQDDDTTNPGLLWVLDAEKLWNRKAGAADKACAAWHNDARSSMKG